MNVGARGGAGEDEADPQVYKPRSRNMRSDTLRHGSRMRVVKGARPWRRRGMLLTMGRIACG